LLKGNWILFGKDVSCDFKSKLGLFRFVEFNHGVTVIVGQQKRENGFIVLRVEADGSFLIHFNELGLLLSVVTEDALGNVDVVIGSHFNLAFHHNNGHSHN
jgi:hypothetical protein